MNNLSRLFFETVFNAAENGLVIIDNQGNIVHWNAWFASHSGISLTEVKGHSLLAVFPNLAQSSLARAVTIALRHQMASLISYALNRQPLPLKNLSGQAIAQHTIVKPMILVDADESYCLIQVTDISAAVNREKQLIEQLFANKLIAESLAQEQERATVTLNSIAEAVITTNANGQILSMNPVAEDLMGYSESEALAMPLESIFQIIDESDRKPIMNPVTQCLTSGKPIANVADHLFINRRQQKFAVTESVAPILNRNGEILGTVLVIRDVSHSRALSSELQWQAQHDYLTGLANRRVFEARMKVLLESSLDEPKQELHQLLYLDLDQFKVVNDICGHDAGDELLRQIIDCFKQHIRTNDLLARLGGDEFGILLENCNPEVGLRIANDIRQSVQDFRFVWQNRSFRIGVSIGVAEINGNEAKAPEILSAADAACYVAKEQGRNRVHYHEFGGTGASALQQQEMQWIARIQEALDKDRFVLFGQRIQNINTLNVPTRHYEILVRMKDANDKLIPPGAFLPAAERFNLIASIDRWVVENVINWLVDAIKRDPLAADIVLSINLSGASMADDLLLADILTQLDNPLVSAINLCFEVTETAAITNLTNATRFLSVLREKGCKVALDDFGSGLSSFAYLKALPVDYLKIDGHFVKDIADDLIDRAFVDTINKIAQVMGLQTIAEFVENDAILAVLAQLGVNYAQGYGVHKPCQLDEIGLVNMSLSAEPLQRLVG